jgi:hypothetical protein
VRRGNAVIPAASDGANPMTRVMLRPLASPLPVGFLALAIGSFVVTGVQLNWPAT